VTPQPDFHGYHIRTYYLARVEAPAGRFRRDFAESLTGWRLGAGLPTRTDWQREEAVFREGLAEIVRLRLMDAYAPLFAGIRTIDRLFGGVAALAAPADRDFWAPKRQRPRGFKPGPREDYQESAGMGRHSPHPQTTRPPDSVNQHPRPK
jgi:hypothetical protein